MNGTTRRDWLRQLASAAAMGWAGGLLGHASEPSEAASAPKRFPIGACDWSMGRTADVRALSLAREIGLDGVQVSLGTVENDMHLRQPSVQEAYRQASKETGVAIASLAIGELNRVPYKHDPRTIDWVRDSIQVAENLGCSVVLLAFFGKGDLRDDPEGQDEVVRRLREVGPRAEDAGVVLGIESWLSAKEHVELMERVDSPAVQVYYDVANSHRRGYDIDAEIRWLGDRRICELHMKENGALLGEGEVDFHAVRDAIEAIGYSDWLIIEGALPSDTEIQTAYRRNRQFLVELF